MSIDTIVKDWDANPENGQVHIGSFGSIPDGGGEQEKPLIVATPTSAVPPVVSDEVAQLRAELAALKAAREAESAQLKDVVAFKEDISNRALDAEIARNSAERKAAFEAGDYDAMTQQEETLRQLMEEKAKRSATLAAKGKSGEEADTSTAQQTQLPEKLTDYAQKHAKELDGHVLELFKGMGGIETFSEARVATLRRIFLETVKEGADKDLTPEQVVQVYADKIGGNMPARAAKVSSGGSVPPSGGVDVDTAFNKLHPDIKALWEDYASIYKYDKKRFVADYQNVKI